MATSTAERVLEVLARVVETDAVRRDPEIALYERQVLDSLRTVELIVAFSAEFGVNISPAELDREQWATPRLIVQYMEGRIGA